MKRALNYFYKQRIFLWITLFIIFLAAILINNAAKSAFEYDYDEGTNLIESALFLKGFPLYTEIFSDQPPLFTAILSFWLKLFGASTYQARLLTLVFSVILLWAFYQTINNLQGRLCAITAVIFLILSAIYIRLSISVMIGLPAFSFALLSILCITYYRKLRFRRLLLLSGVSMALSLQTKFSTAFLIPIIIVEIMLAQKKNPKGNIETVFGNNSTQPAKQHAICTFLYHTRHNYLTSPIFLWTADLLITYFLIALIFFKFNFSLLIQQLFQFHLTKPALSLSNFNFGIMDIYKILSRDYDICLLAIIGIILLIKDKKLHPAKGGIQDFLMKFQWLGKFYTFPYHKKWRFFLPVSWLILAYIILLKWRPVWYHYYLFISIPLCWLAGISFSEFFKLNPRQGLFKKRDGLYWITAGLIILIIFNLPFKYSAILKEINIGTMPQEYTTLEIMSKYKKYTHWIITDRPIFAFFGNMLVPPELAVIGDKRTFITGASQDYFIAKLEKYKPEQILLSRSSLYGAKALSYIENKYTNIYGVKIPERFYYYDNFDKIFKRWHTWYTYKIWYAYKRFFTNIKPLIKDAWHLNFKKRYYNLFPKISISNYIPDNYTPAYAISLWIRKDILEQHGKE